MGSCHSCFVKEKHEATMVKAHDQKFTHSYVVSYPAHELRTTSPLFQRTRRTLRSKYNCFICGTRDKLEIHHFYIEHAAMFAIDWNKFGAFSMKHYNIQTNEFLGNFNWKDVAKNPELFVDSSANMIVLCKKHHTGCGGIHRIPFPIWILDKFSKKGQTFIKDT